MIIVPVGGGLGNQFFQYALGRRLAIVNKADVKFQIPVYKQNYYRNYCLKYFNTIENIADEKEIEEMKKRCYISEKYFHFNKEILNLQGDAYLQGYWQSEKYFKDIEEVIRQELTLKNKSSLPNVEMATKIQNCNSISLHIRRGDYLWVPNSIIKELYSLEYYHNAANIVASSIDEPQFFIFSDDMEWVKQNLKLKYKMTFVDINDNDKNYEDLNLMSLCKHHIIANSTFSWWGAWLGKNNSKIVIAPRNWFNNKDMNTSDLIPESWIRI
ncbi:alpha-1,2-fucosyltransferase [Clostridium sp. A1-XYC3]|uniref:Alpha-1,2-fucosyltransferase n=1 Tax=Clostridium tanneri TaxID=3037988 RepID=A0ABU4JT62_9CLOT|nr:alpha-1,2-fucosyltransferase [Clostridium sp. A1-XYC3]MDW8801297.1 alpha-1,2-fucosyltransferase [Clostridium sp. A1-XYC3]